ncbi:hypothetical protein SERN_2978 [Serinibacter arcticus]|uniref:Uncharacterized protein n=1 Tax=Serinibacter arcticus TaxID=1655435 RepID=A0A4Z1DY68_9MICO|nr:hypothetical protein SERN_2978 [Serinibacter arcticus]
MQGANRSARSATVPGAPFGASEVTRHEEDRHSRAAIRPSRPVASRPRGTLEASASCARSIPPAPRRGRRRPGTPASVTSNCDEITCSIAGHPAKEPLCTTPTP